MLSKQQTFELLRIYGLNYVSYLINAERYKITKQAADREPAMIFFERYFILEDILRRVLKQGQKVTILHGRISYYIDNVTDNNLKIELLQNLNIAKIINELNIIIGR